MSAYFVNSIFNEEFSNLLIIAAFSNKSLSGNPSLSVINLYLLTFSDDQAQILAVYLSKLY